jgi:hypothetical protein
MSTSISKSAAVRPKAKAGIGDKKYLFAIYLIVAVRQRRWIIAMEHGGEVAILKADGLDLFTGQVRGAPGNVESAFR